jgi:CRISPR-associated protein Cmr3
VSLWTLEPRDPLVVRDGRPNDGRSESATLPFPYPGTVAGMVRTRIGSDERGVFDTGQDLEALRRVAIRGPLLARPDAGILYVPRPHDAIVFGGAICRLGPIGRPEGAIFDDRLRGSPVGLRDARPSGKPAKAPAWWPWDLFARWLAEPAGIEGQDAVGALGDCLGALPVEARAHVKLTETWTADEGKLFEVRGLRFSTDRREPHRREPLALAVDVDAAGRTLRAGIAPGGGERRLVRWEPAPALLLPPLPGGVRAALEASAPRVRVRVVLLTPAIFAAGSTPGGGPQQLLGPRCGIKPEPVAACVPRPETISGWDFEKQRPKRTRRVVPAGSVYWLDLEGAPEDRVRWAEEVMMSNVSDVPQDRHDGFGLAAVGVGS